MRFRGLLRSRMIDSKRTRSTGVMSGNSFAHHAHARRPSRGIPSGCSSTAAGALPFQTKWQYVAPGIGFAHDSTLEGDGFESSVPRVMDGDLGRQVPALIAVFELAGTAVTLQRGTKMIRPDRHPEFP